MKLIFLFLLAAVVVLSSCQKEIDATNTGGTPGSGGGSTSSELLTRSVEVFAADSNVTTYGYDAAKRLVLLDLVGRQADYTARISRNASGIITKYSVSSPVFAVQGFDSIVTTVFYNASSSRYTAARSDITASGITLADSSAFVYDAGGSLVSKMMYSKVFILPYSPSGRADYTYASGNVATEKSYNYNDTTNTYALYYTISYTYDTKVNPLSLGVEGILIGSSGGFGPNNVIRFDFSDATDPLNNSTRTTSYTYNAVNKPSGGTAVQNPGSVTSTLRLYYK